MCVLVIAKEVTRILHYKGQCQQFANLKNMQVALSDKIARPITALLASDDGKTILQDKAGMRVSNRLRVLQHTIFDTMDEAMITDNCFKEKEIFGTPRDTIETVVGLLSEQFKTKNIDCYPTFDESSNDLFTCDW